MSAYDTMPLSGDGVDLLEAMVAFGPQHEADCHIDGFKALGWLGLIEECGGGYWRITDEGIGALTFQIVRA